MPVDHLENLIGDTPLMRLRCLGREETGVHVYGKLECFNPAGSVKDRSAYQLLRQARIDHHMEPGWTIVESSSGNMGHALAMLCAAYKLKFICVLDSKAPKSNITVIRAYGGKVELVETPDETGSFQKTRIAVARRLARELPRCVNLDQYNNPAAIAAHFKTTGPEIYTELGGNVDVLIGCASTGSHLSGTAKYMKSRKPGIHVIGVEPEGSVVFGGAYKPFLQNGTGLSFRPGNLLETHIDEIIKVSDHDAFSTCRRLARTEGLLLGGSSGSVLHVASLVAIRMRRPGNIAVILPDNGMKYLDTIYDDQWLRKHGLHAAIAGDEVMSGERPTSRRAPIAEVESTVGELQDVPLQRVMVDGIAQYGVENLGLPASRIDYAWPVTVDEALGRKIVDLLRATSAVTPIVGFGGVISDPEARTYLGELRDNLAGNKWRLLTISADDRIVGLCTLRRNSNPNNRHLADLCKGMIDVRYRGGFVLSAGLYEVALQCLDDGIELITLDVRIDVPARALWERWGFLTHGRLEDYSRVGGKSFAGQYMSQPTLALKTRALRNLRIAARPRRVRDAAPSISTGNIMTRQAMPRDEFAAKLRDTLEAQLTLDHPIFAELFRAELNRPLLRMMSLEGYQITRYFLSYVDNLHFHCPLPAHKRRLLYNLFEEETGRLSKTKNHVELMKDFLRAQGISDEERDAHQPSGQTRELIRYRLDAVQNPRTYHIGAAAVMIASEGQSLEKRAGDARHTLLGRIYGLSENDTRFFSVHQKEDVAHVKEGIDLVADLCVTTAMQDEALFAVAHTCRLFWNMYDSVAQRYWREAPAGAVAPLLRESNPSDLVTA